MSIRLVLIDVDGTLVGPSGIPDEVWNAASRARARGLHLAICTGRSGVGDALGYAKRLDERGFHIFDSGAVVTGGDGTVRRAAELGMANYATLLDLARRHAIDLEVYTAEGEFFIAAETPVLATHQRGIGRVATIRVLDDLPGRIVRVQFVSRFTREWSEVRAQILTMPDVELHEATSPIQSDVCFASVTARGVSKKSAAGYVASQLGLADLSRVAMIGDGDNDLELIRAAGRGIAMGNAPDHVKAAASRVVARVENTGLAEALDQL
jgi:Cof subfamily protein (haloacid dehalogenase superfamily)